MAPAVEPCSYLRIVGNTGVEGDGGEEMDAAASAAVLLWQPALQRPAQYAQQFSPEPLLGIRELRPHSLKKEK